MEQTYFTIIPNRSCSAILLQEIIDGWILPSFTFKDQHFWQAVDHINQVILGQYNIHVTTLNCVQIIDDDIHEKIAIFMEKNSDL